MMNVIVAVRRVCVENGWACKAERASLALNNFLLYYLEHDIAAISRPQFYPKEVVVCRTS